LNHLVATFIIIARSFNSSYKRNVFKNIIKLRHCFRLLFVLFRHLYLYFRRFNSNCSAFATDRQ